MEKIIDTFLDFIKNNTVALLAMIVSLNSYMLSRKAYKQNTDNLSIGFGYDGKVEKDEKYDRYNFEVKFIFKNQSIQPNTINDISFYIPVNRGFKYDDYIGKGKVSYKDERPINIEINANQTIEKIICFSCNKFDYDRIVSRDYITVKIETTYKTYSIKFYISNISGYNCKL